MNAITQSVLIGLAALAVSACDDKGPLEQAGEEADEAIEDMANGGEEFANKMDDAVDEIRDGAEDARRELTN